MNTSPFISVIIPVYNAARTLEQCLQCLLNQTLPQNDYEVIVVDNGSTDNTRKIIIAFRDKFASFTLVNEANPGPSSARNAGALMAKGNLFSFIDADCYASENWLVSMQNAFLAKSGKVGAIGGEIKVFNRDDTIYQYYERRKILDQQKFIFKPSKFSFPFCATANLSVRREVFYLLNGFDTQLISGEDADFCWRMQWLGWQLDFESHAWVYHHFSPRAASIYRVAQKYGYGTRELFRKYRSRFSQRYCLEPNVWLWLLKAALKVPYAGLFGRNQYERKEPIFDFLSNAGYITGKLKSTLHLLP